MKQNQPQKLILEHPAGLDKLESLYNFLKQQGTFDIKPLNSGLFRAVGQKCKTANISGYKNIWVRDNIHIAYAFYETGSKIKAKKCVTAIASFFRKHIYRLKNIITHKADPNDPMQRPHIRFSGLGLKEINQPWGHAQNDAIGYFLWFYCKLTREGIIPEKDADIDLLAVIAKYLDAICYWKDKDSGHWEEEQKISASSIAIALAGLQEFEKLIGDLNLKTKFQKDAKYRLSKEKLRLLIRRGWISLNKILPYECIEKDPALNRAYDAALIFAIEPVELISAEKADMILSLVRKYLMGKYGIRRYLMDRYWQPNYRQADKTESGNKKINEFLTLGYEAQWCIFDPVISTIYGKRFLKSSSESDYQKQLFHFNRSISQITDKHFELPYQCPEAWFFEKGKYVPNDQVPLTWTQANLMVAFKYMKLSLKHLE
ncbi:MAG: glycoside hydrolase family 15 protein [Phycisphaerae bacterium]